MKPEYDISPDEYELIENYLLAGLSPQERTAFDDKMKSDANWNQKVDEVRLLLTGVQESGLRASLDQYHQDLAKEVKPRSEGKVLSMNVKWMAAASVLLALSITAWLFFGKSRPEKLYSSYYSPDPGLLTAMGPATNYDFEKGMVDYKNGQYQAAIDNWNGLLKQDPANDTLHYFIGVANQAINNLDIARTHLKPVATNSQSRFANDASWYLGLIFLKQNQRDSAIQYLQKANHSKKAALLNDLNQNE